MELESEYLKLPGAIIQIAIFQIIDVKYTSEAENEVCDTYDKQFTNMKKMYRRIGDDFAGATLGLQK